MTETTEFSVFFAERLKNRGITLRRLSELANIPVGHLEHLRDGAYDRLPPAPYVRGYLYTLGRILEFDPAAWWSELCAHGMVSSSGGADMLPTNRFSGRPLAVYFLVSIGVLVLLLYVGIRFSVIFGQPVVTLNTPADSTSIVRERALILRGAVQNGDELEINAEPVSLAPNGTWEKTLTLEPGLNVIRFVARKFLGGKSQFIRQVIYEPEHK